MHRHSCKHRQIRLFNDLKMQHMLRSSSDAPNIVTRMNYGVIISSGFSAVEDIEKKATDDR